MYINHQRLYYNNIRSFFNINSIAKYFLISSSLSINHSINKSKRNHLNHPTNYFTLSNSIKIHYFKRRIPISSQLYLSITLAALTSKAAVPSSSLSSFSFGYCSIFQFVTVSSETNQFRLIFCFIRSEFAYNNLH